MAAPDLLHNTGVSLRFLLVLTGTAAMTSCGGDNQPLSPSPLTSRAVPRASLSVGPSDYHEDPSPMPDPAPAPAALTIDIVGSSGSAAFLPNPMQAAVGNTLVWSNTDTRPHRIVLDDGTVIGNIEPGAASAPVALTAATTSYYCTIHPSMVGIIQDPSAPAPAPPPVYEPPPDDGYYDY